MVRNEWLMALVLGASGGMVTQTGEPSAESGAPIVIPGRTPVAITIMADLDSKQNHEGDKFPIALASAVTIDNVPVLPSGALGEGEVVHAARARAAGKPGELIINARFVSCNGVRVPLGHLHFMATGDDRSHNPLFLAPYVFVSAAFVSGGQMRIMHGTRVEAQTTAEVRLPHAMASCAAPAS